MSKNKNNVTYYNLILDSSGSMDSVRKETISAFNEQIQAIKALQEKFPEQEFKVSLTTFNSFVDFTFDAVPANEVSELTEETYVPNNMTAMLDAIGDSIQRLQSRAGDEIRADKATAVVVILTDGYENASTRYTYAKISSMIKELEATGDWTFSFLGADIDADAMAVKINIRQANTQAFAKEAMGETMAQVSVQMEDYAKAKSRGIKKRDFLK